MKIEVEKNACQHEFQALKECFKKVSNLPLIFYTYYPVKKCRLLILFLIIFSFICCLGEENREIAVMPIAEQLREEHKL